MGDRPKWWRWRRVFRPDARAEVDEELSFHIEQRVRDYMARGLDAEAARRSARERLGDIDRARTECVELLESERRSDERLMRLNISWLDVKLGLRMAARYPGLSLVAVVGMAVAIAIGAGAFGAIDSMMETSLPFDEGDGIVSLQNNRADNPGNPERRALHDFVMWRDELRSVVQLGAVRMNMRNLVDDGDVELIQVAEMTATGFGVTRVAPALGRTLLEADEHPGAPPVVVIAHEEWQRRFDADPDIIGRTLRIGGTIHTIVGVMPPGFRFPTNIRFWVPFRLDPADYARGDGPSILMFGRLADGVGLGQARAELAAIGQRMAAAYPETHAQLRPLVMPFTHPFVELDDPLFVWALHFLQFLISLLLVVVAVNVAVLIYARTATRTGEIAVRSALGASRGRVVSQLFIEALVLSMVAAAIGLTVAAIGLEGAEDFQRRLMGDQWLFWMDLGLSPALVLYVIALAVVAAVIVGVVPALKSTGKHLQAGLQQLSSRGSSLQLGRTWTVLIVAQVAIAVAILPFAIHNAIEFARTGTVEPAYAADELVRAYLTMEREEAPPRAQAAAWEEALRTRFLEGTAELLRRLENEPSADGVTFASHFPGTAPFARIEVEGSAGAPSEAAFTTQVNRIDPDLLDVFDVPILSGRGFVQADAREGSTTVIVNDAFAERIAPGGGEVLGRRVRHIPPRDRDGRESVPGPWLQIVGVVPNFSQMSNFDPTAKLYHAISPAQLPAEISLAVRVRRAPVSAFAGRLREIAAGVDPALQLHEVRSVAETRRLEQKAYLYTALAIVGGTASVLLLSAAGVYAMMAFTVARRRREIGIRAALGADPRRILTGIFARAAAQLGTGVLIGLASAALLILAAGDENLSAALVTLVPAVSAIMLVIGLLAALGPARRGLRVQPTEALREE